MKSTFDQYCDIVLFPAEGTYSDHEADRGGVTHWGLSAKFLDSIGQNAPATMEEARAIYRQFFWEGHGCDQMHPVAGWLAMDAYVQHPPRAATKMLQTGLGVSADGVIGPLTRQAAREPNVLLLWRRYRLARIRYYNGIVRNDMDQSVFIDGWHERLHRLAEGLLAAGLITETPKGWKTVFTGPGVKAAATGTGFAAIVAALGFEPGGLWEWLQGIAAESSAVGIATAWLARIAFGRKEREES